VVLRPNKLEIRKKNCGNCIRAEETKYCVMKLRVVPCIERGNRAHGGCDRSTGDAYSSMAPDPTSDIFRGLCTPILWFVFPIRLMRLITDRYFCHFIAPNLSKDDLNFSIVIFPICIAIYRHHLHMVFISHNVKLIGYHFWCSRCRFRLINLFSGTQPEKVVIKTLVLSQHFANSTVVITIWFANKTLHWVEWCVS
jgi:hypothetical protein